MANRKANSPRCMMRVPVDFRDRVNKEADEHRLPATTYLEGKRVIEDV